MANTYIVSSQKSTAVHHAVSCSFLSPGEADLVVARGSQLEIFSAAEDSLSLKIKTNLHGIISSLIAFKPEDSSTDVIFVLTERKDFIVLRFDAEKEALVTVEKGSVRDRVGTDVESGQRALLDPEKRMVGMLLYDGNLKVLPIEPSGFQEAFNVPIEEPRLIDIVFLSYHSKPTYCILYEDNKMSRFIKTYSIDIREKVCTETSWPQSSVEISARMLIPVNGDKGVGGVIVVGQSTISYVNGKSNSQSISMDHNFVTSYCSLDRKGNRYLLGDKYGFLSVLILLRESSSGEVSGLVLEKVGTSSIPERLCFLKDDLLYVGSCFGDSQLLKLLPGFNGNDSDNQKSSAVEVLETYDNIGPIIDMCVVPTERHNQNQVVCCSGGYKDGSIRVIKNGIGIRENACIEMEGIKGIWSLQHSRNGDYNCSIYDKYLVQAFTWETRVMWIDEDEEMSECSIPGFCSESTTIYCGNMVFQNKDFFVQVTPTSVRLVQSNTGEMISEMAFEEKIVVAEGNLNQLALALSGGELVYVELCVVGTDLSQTTALKKIISLKLDQDIACMSIRPEVQMEKGSCQAVDANDINLLDRSKALHSNVAASQLHLIGKSSLLVVGFWTDNSVRLYALPSLVELTRASLGVDVQVRAVLLTSLTSHTVGTESLGEVATVDEESKVCKDSDVHLLIGLGDGRVITYIVSVGRAGNDGCTEIPSLSHRQEVHLGSTPISFSPFVHEDALCVFASCDRPTVIHSRNRFNSKLLFSPVNSTGEVTQMAPFHTPLFPHCLTMSSHDGLFIGTIDSLQTINIQTRHLGESPRHICFHKESSIYVVSSVLYSSTKKGDSIHDRMLFLDKDFETKCVIELDPYESCLSCITLPFNAATVSVEDNESSTLSQPVEYVVAGTAYVVPNEKEPTSGRILVFRIHTSEDQNGSLQINVALVTEQSISGGAFCLGNVNGKLVAGVNSNLHIYRFIEGGPNDKETPELFLEFEYVGHILSLFCKVSGDLVLVGDILRSVSLLQYNEATNASGNLDISLKEVSRDFNSNYLRAIEMLDEDFYLGAEDSGNVFVLKRNTAIDSSTSLSEEERNRLDTQSAYHLGDFVNVFCKGIMGINSDMCGTESPSVSTCGDDSFGDGVKPVALFGTVGGSLGAVFTLSDEAYHFLNVLEKALNQVIRGVGGLSHEDYRQFVHSSRHEQTRRTVDGDLIEMFLDLPSLQMTKVVKFMNDEMQYLANSTVQEACKLESKMEVDAKDNTSTVATKFSVESVVRRVEELVRLH